MKQIRLPVSLSVAVTFKINEPNDADSDIEML